MNRCVCLGLGAYVDGDDVTGGLRVEPCELHPLSRPPDETPDVAAGLRVDHCLEAVARVRDLLWPDGKPQAAWPSDRIDEIARVLEFVRPPVGQGTNAHETATPEANGPAVTVTLDRLVTVAVDVELPVTCPHCGLSFDGERSLLEEGYRPTHQPCAIGTFEGRLVVDRYAEPELVYDIGIATGYECAGCRTTVVSTRDAAAHPDAKAGA